MPLQSHFHPQLLLGAHIEQVSAARAGIFKWHSHDENRLEITRWCEALEKTHDLGKGTQAFQEYISNPSNYIGNPDLKRHSQLSQLLILLLAEEEKWDPLKTLALSACALGHHSGFPTFEKLRELGGGKAANLLKQQCSIVETQDLQKATDLPITCLLLDNRPWRKAEIIIDKKIKPVFKSLSLEQAVDFRLKTQFLFSTLLEADKAFLAISDPEAYLALDRKIWEPAWIDKKIGTPVESEINTSRHAARKALIEQTQAEHSNRIFNLTAPTGIGKTMLAATWAFEQRKNIEAETGVPPKIIVVLPFLSIIDQTAREYETLLREGIDKPDGSWFLTSHSLSDRQYGNYEMEESTEAFFIDTWRTELVITTYDQFLLSLLSPKARHQMRFHNLCDALIIMDEVQSLPCRLWKPLESVLLGLTKFGSTRVLLMSATLPPFVSSSKSLLPNHEKYFSKFHRYSIFFDIQEKTRIHDFIDGVCEQLPEWLKKGRRILLTLNTRRSARAVRDALAVAWPQEFIDIPLFFLSADVTPLDRLRNINQIAQGRPCVVVSTQCIEAGVDIDMDMVVRDFAPLDSLIQIAGRCNREGTKERCTVRIVDLVSENGRRFSEMIYDDVHMQETRQLVSNIDEIKEEDILELTNKYFAALAKKKNLGDEHVERFARWEEDFPVRTLLRGEDREKDDILVRAQDLELKNDMQAAASVEDRWKRREAWRKLAGRIAKVTISIYANRKFAPESIASEWYGHWLLNEGYYDSERGLTLPQDPEGDTLIL